ncbi:MAG: penicillin-binding protein activator [Deltaproteobacteria bacterium]|nr:penicillin-binding protein activator [Deltaproteobacteria bacterium]
MNFNTPFNKPTTLLMILFACIVFFDAAKAADREAPRFHNAAPLDVPQTAFAHKASGDPHKIGLILPLTGENEAFGRRALDAVLLGSGVFDAGSNNPLTLIIEDSKSRREAAEKAVAKLADVDGVIGIIGPLEGLGDEAAAQKAQQLRIPILTLTAKKGITDVGEYVFRNFMTDEMQVKSLVKYATGELGSIRFAVLYPDNFYGQEMKELFRSEVLHSGGKIMIMQSYNASQTDFRDVIPALTAGKNTPDDPKETLLKRAIPFDTLFIPDSYANFRLIAAQLMMQGIQGIQLLGTNALHHPDMLKAGQAHLEGVIFTDGFFLNSYRPEVNDFSDLYYASYGREPDFIDAIAFDTIKIFTGILRGRKTDTREKFREELLKLNSHHGVTGTISSMKQRSAKKEAFILSVTNGQIIQVK